jgi:hypothetical protein
MPATALAIRAIPGVEASLFANLGVVLVTAAIHGTAAVAYANRGLIRRA